MGIATIIETATLDQRRDTARALKKPRTRKRLLNLASRALARADAAIAKAAAALPPPRPIACGPGCPYCCHIRVTASPPEIVLMLAHIQETWDVAALQTLKRKIKNIDGLTRGLGDDGRAQLRLPCPLLKDGSCAVHPVRPLSCRAVASVDLHACQAAYGTHMATGVPMFEPQYQAANAVGYGLYAGLVDAGFGVSNIELNAALAIGLDDPDLAQRWLNGETVFAPCLSGVD